MTECLQTLYICSPLLYCHENVKKMGGHGANLGTTGGQSHTLKCENTSWRNRGIFPYHIKIWAIKSEVQNINA